MNKQELLNACHARGIEIRNNVDSMKAELIQILIQDVINKGKELVETRKSEMIKEVMEKPET